MRLFQKSFQAMSTGIEVKFYTDRPKVDADSLLIEVENEFYRIAATYTRFSESSELSSLNKKSGEKAQVSAELFALIEELLEFAEFSEGKFDPTVIDLLELHGYDKSFSKDRIDYVQSLGVTVEPLLANRPKWSEIELDETTQTVKLQLSQRLDLGSIGKGYALDRAAEILLAAGIEDYLIEAGGDVISAGMNLEENRNWVVALTLPAGVGTTNLAMEIELSPQGEAVASSGSWARATKSFHHLLDPDTGKPKTGIIQTAVRAETATIADGLATVLFLKGQDYIDKIYAEYAAKGLVVTDQGNVLIHEYFMDNTAS
jgi:thiamine biosynthesis lipoprotein